MNPAWIAVALAGLYLVFGAKKATATEPTGTQGEPDETGVWQLYLKYSQSEIGTITAVTAFSIWQWETGHGTSRLWLKGHNPGGLKYHPEIATVGHTFGSLSGSDGTMAAFPDATEGVKAHFRWFAMSRYQAAREASSHEQEAVEIFKAGYAEDPGWLSGVMALIRKNEQV